MAQKEPMIARADRPTAIDYDAPIGEWKMRDVLAVIDARIAELIKPEKEMLKPPEKEFLKPAEKEFFKPPEKEFLKPEKEYSKPEKEVGPEGVEERVAKRVIAILEERGILK